MKYSIMCCALALIPFFVLAEGGANHPSVVITEVMWMGTSAGSTNEWLELGLHKNFNQESITLDGWSIYLQKQEKKELLASLDGLTLNKEQPIVIARSTTNTALDREPDHTTSTLKLPNSKLLLLLENADSQIIDSVDDGVGTPFAGSNPSGGQGRASMERISLDLPGTEKTSWRSATTSTGFAIDSDNFGTPGVLPEEIVIDDSCTDPNPRIHIQSGNIRDFKKISINVQALDLGSNAACRWEYSDGYTVASCNPPSHTFSTVGMHQIQLFIDSHCEGEISRTLQLEVLPEAAKDSHNLSIEDEEEEHSCIPSVSTGIIINEVFPYPESGEEFIELKNVSGKEQHLCGLLLGDNSKDVPLDHLTIGDYKTLALYKRDTGINLNNDSDTITLKKVGQSGGVLSRISYENSKKHWSYSLRQDHQFIWTPHVSPDEENSIRTGERLFESSPISVRSVLPNPEGKDEYGEYIEIENISGRPLLLHPFQILVRTQAGTEQRMNFESGDALRVSEVRKLMQKESGLSLPNTNASVAIIDSAHHVLSLLSWKSASANTVVTQKNDDSASIEGRVLSVEKSGIVKVQLYQLPGKKSDNRLPFMVDVVLPNVTLATGAVQLLRENLESKQVMLQFDNPLQTLAGEYRASITTANGVDIESLLLRHGRALCNTWSKSPKLRFYQELEHEARQSKLGLWKDNKKAKNALQQRREQERFYVLEQEGIRVNVNAKPGLIEQDSIIEFRPNIKQSKVFVSINSGAFQLSSGLIEVHDSMHVKAYAVTSLLDGVGPLLTSDIWQGWFGVSNEEWLEVFISEVYPSPLKDENEWIELYNPHEQDIDLTHWILDDIQDGGSRAWKVPAGTIIKANSYNIFSKKQTGLTLNDGEDSVHLSTPDGVLVDSIEYEKSKRGFSFSSPMPGSNRKLCLSEKTPTIKNNCNSDLALVKNKKQTKKRSRKTSVKKVKDPLRTLKSVSYLGEGMQALIDSVYHGSGQVVVQHNSSTSGPITFIHITLLLLIGAVQVIVLIALRRE